MKKAKLKKTGIMVYIHEAETPTMFYNRGKLVVSKQPDSPYVFSVDPDDLAIEEDHQ